MIMNMQPVTSSNINAIGYDEQSRKLRVQFKSGLYEYDDVEPGVVKNLMESDSVGKFVSANIAKQYKYKRVEEDDNGR